MAKKWKRMNMKSKMSLLEKRTVVLYYLQEEWAEENELYPENPLYSKMMDENEKKVRIRIETLTERELDSLIAEAREWGYCPEGILQSPFTVSY
jgi:hypothetical protein